MLYKKYHRNYIRQFKKGTMFILKDYADNYIRKVTEEPYIELWDEGEFYITVKVMVLREASSLLRDVTSLGLWLNSVNSVTSLIDYNGRLMKKDVIQKIS